MQAGSHLLDTGSSATTLPGCPAGGFPRAESWWASPGPQPPVWEVMSALVYQGSASQHEKETIVRCVLVSGRKQHLSGAPWGRQRRGNVLKAHKTGGSVGKL